MPLVRGYSMRSNKPFGTFRVGVVAGALLAAGFSSAVLARDVFVLGGSTFSSTSKYHYLGLVVPIQQQSLDQDGFLFRGWTSYRDFRYITTLPGGPPNINVDVDGAEFEAAVGYQRYFGKDTRITGYLGLMHRNLDASPDDPTTNFESKRNGIKLQLEGTTRSGKFGVSAIGSYAFGFEDYWLRVRPAYYLGDSLNIGPEFVASGGQKYTKQQLGIFLEGIRLGTRASLGLKLGSEHNSRSGPNSGSKTYGGVSFSARF